MKYFCFVSVLLVSVLLGGGAWAQTATPTPLLEYDSVGGTGSLPGAYWTINGNGSATLSPVQGGLVFTDNNGTTGLAYDIYYQGAGVSADTTSGWTVIVRAKKNSDTAVDRGGQIFCHNSTNAAEGYVGMGLGRRTSGVQRANRVMLHGSENNMTEASGTPSGLS